MDPIVHHIDGWKVQLKKGDGLLRFFAEAKHEQHNRYQWADAVDMRDALLRLADCMGMEGGRLLTLFGQEP